MTREEIEKLYSNEAFYTLRNTCLELLAERDHLRQRLEKYGRHEHDFVPDKDKKTATCKCGIGIYLTGGFTPPTSESNGQTCTCALDPDGISCEIHP